MNKFTSNKALSPEEAIERFKSEIPEEVLECWNNLIVKNMTMQNGKTVSVFKLSELKQNICVAMKSGSETVKERGWLDLEDVFREKGWKVEFDKPAYNETYEPVFRFKNH